MIGPMGMTEQKLDFASEWMDLKTVLNDDKDFCICEQLMHLLDCFREGFYSTKGCSIP